MDLPNAKRLQLEQRIENRDKRSSSVVDALGLEHTGEIGELVDSGAVSVTDKPNPCTECNGEGVIKGLFRSYECAVCHGTTFDLSNPIAIIRWQNACLGWAKRELQVARNEAKLAGLTPEELAENAHEEFYRNARRLD